MTRLRLILVIVAVLLLLLLAGGAGAWYYLFGGTNAAAAADLVPADTVFFATIPNSVDLIAGYQTSQLKTLMDSPNMQPLLNSVQQQIGDKKANLLAAFGSNLIGQSFIAVTHFDADHPEQTGFVAAMKPKQGLDNFDAFVENLKTNFADQLKDATTGNGNVDGVDYQWIQGPGAKDKVCVAKLGGWIVTTWGETSLQDWIERYQKKSATPSLSQNADYQKSLARIGPDSLAYIYFNYHVVLDLLQKSAAKVPGHNMAFADYISKKFGSISGAAMGMHFENGQIMDRFSLLIPKQAQADMGVSATPCAYETLNFTGPDTLFYAAYNVDWKKSWQNLQDQEQMRANLMAGSPGMYPPALLPPITQAVQNWAQGAGLDFQHNILDALGSEVSVQLDWGQDAPYPELGVFVKLDKPDDFQPVIKALIETVRKATASEAIITELNSNNHNFASLKYVTRPVPYSPTITEDGPYLALFLTEQQAVRSFDRTESLELTHNKDFVAQVGDKRNGTAQVVFLDSPRLLNRTYTTVLPYLSMAAMFNATLSKALNGQNLPPDLSWLAPIGTWSMVVSTDDDGLKGYSISGVGNQGIFYGAGLAGSLAAAQAMGYLPKMQPSTPAGYGQTQGSISITPVPQVTGTINATATIQVTTNGAPASPVPPPAPSTNTPPAPDQNTPATNATPAPDMSPPATNSTPAAPAPAPDSTSNTAPTPAPDTTTSNASPSTPTTSNPQ